MLTTDGATGQSDRLDTILSKLAQALNCPQEAFMQSVSCELSQGTELLRLWHSIESSADRAKALANVRSIAEQARG